MIYKVVAIRDRAIDAFGQPVFVANTGGAIRSFGDEIRKPSTPERPNALHDHPDDYDLYLIGTYDDATGELFSMRPEQIAVGKDYRE